MSTHPILSPKQRPGAIVALVICVLIAAGAILASSIVQRDFGRVEVSDVWFRNYNGIEVRAKLFRPKAATKSSPVPGVVYIHGYQNNRETGDAYSIEIARRGIAVLNIDAIGRGHSGIPGDPKEKNFDTSYGGKSAVQYLKGLEFVNPGSVGILGHSLGAEMAYTVALADPTINALVITGFAYRTDSTPNMPRNMLMIIGQYDEFRNRMTGTRDIRGEWMKTERTKKAIAAANPEIGVTYGDFARGTARRVYVPPITHVHESHHSGSIAETVEWLRRSLNPPASQWIESGSQIWMLKEFGTLIAMLAAFASLIPLALVLIRLPLFNSLAMRGVGVYSCGTADYLKFASINGVLIWLYLPFILILFAIHKFVVPIQAAFPMMMVNAIVWWLLLVNIIGLLLFRRWYRKRANDLSLIDLGVARREGGLKANAGDIGMSLVFAFILFLFMYLIELAAEKLCIVNFRFVWPFMNDLTPYRMGMFALYFPFVLFCFIVTGIFLHGQIRRPAGAGWAKTFASWSLYNIAALCVPIVLFLLVQYVPLFTTGFIPFQGPGGLFVVFIISLWQILLIFAITAVLSTWIFQLTGTVYAGAFLNALIITWMLVSAQVIAPIPV